ncbi:acyltransferase family protein [Pseudooceanicola spongiae]|uniref:Acyltransferase family protein n=1 Tax=Pseudooceanicola spongiae TaxID=2613965 RepID=A0A7L9WJB2_9RHOB|nr:acyltransferase family protein [Pseudooceanicola spongiae]QOL80062.1 acyltransferase family protein [Pseudooceanicola spongiae]
MNEITSTNRLTYLETARGIASVIVVFHHFLLGFFPLLKTSVTQGGLAGTPLYVLVNGLGAVAFFFVLSGFVLTRKFYQKFLIQDLAASLLKRLPRLMLPAALSVMIGAAIVIYYPEAHGAAAQLTGSDWLAAFAYAGFPKDFIPSFSDAAANSLLVFLRPGHAYYNSNLWTMVYEFYGSLIVFAIVAISVALFFSKHSSVILIHIFLAVLFLVLPLMMYVPFVIGSLLAFLHSKRSMLFKLRPWSVAVLVLTMLAGYSFDSWYAIIIASTATMILLLGITSLEKKLSGPFGLFLGRLSFPLYLVHVLVILSVTSAAYTVLTVQGVPLWGVLMLCLALTWAVSLLAALPFMALESFWVTALNRWSRALVRQFVR